MVGKRLVERGPCEDPREGTSRKREEPVPRSYDENFGVLDEAGS